MPTAGLPLMPPLIQAIIGTTRPSRFSENVAGWLTHRLADRTDIDFEIVDLRDHPIPFFEEKVAPGAVPAKLRQRERGSPGTTR